MATQSASITIVPHDDGHDADFFDLRGDGSDFDWTEVNHTMAEIRKKEVDAILELERQRQQRKGERKRKEVDALLDATLMCDEALGRAPSSAPMHGIRFQ